MRAYLERPHTVHERFAERMRCVPRILAALNARMGRPLDEHELADLSQDTTVLVLQKLDQYAAKAPLESWIYRICSLELMNGVRRKHRYRGRTERLVESTLESAEAQALEEIEAVHLALERLGGHDADVVRMKHFEGLTFEDLGDRLGISPNTAKTRYYRGLAKLKTYMGLSEDGGDERAAR